MTRPIISVEHLGKSYLVGHQAQSNERYTALRDVVGRSVKNFGRKAIDMARGRQIIQGDEVEEFWALKDLSFEVNEGEVVGIIGRNGAGKSTLLKILSRITEPTKGKVTLRGRVASLLEVGTGFHPELTGRENIFLNGAILGMTRVEITQKFDEIVNFAGVETFLDTPVKRYSSGMYVRLAFAVAAHLEPEILIVDEVLAVGDLEFQKKCMGKMQDVAAEGRTVLFVSHALPTISRLCTRAICLQHGTIAFSGPPNETIKVYSDSSSGHKLSDRKFAGVGEVVEHAKEIGIYVNEHVVIHETHQVVQQNGLKVMLLNKNISNDFACGLAIFSNGQRLTTIIKFSSNGCFEYDLSKLNLRAGQFEIGVGFSKHPDDREWAWNPRIFELSILDEPCEIHPLEIGFFHFDQ